MTLLNNNSQCDVYGQGMMGWVVFGVVVFITESLGVGGFMVFRPKLRGSVGLKVLSRLFDNVEIMIQVYHLYMTCTGSLLRCWLNESVSE